MIIKNSWVDVKLIDMSEKIDCRNLLAMPDENLSIHRNWLEHCESFFFSSSPEKFNTTFCFDHDREIKFCS